MAMEKREEKKLGGRDEDEGFEGDEKEVMFAALLEKSSEVGNDRCDCV